jgi:hypothetical protein
MGFFGELLQDVTGKSKRPEIKGGRFENFVSDEIFTDKLFDLVEMTRDLNSNSERFEERSMNPDFLFRDKRTHEEFWIEANIEQGFSETIKDNLSARSANPGNWTDTETSRKSAEKKSTFAWVLARIPIS